MKLVVHWRILLLFLPILFLQDHKVSGQCRQDEQEALLQLKNGFFNFSAHAGIATWRSDIDCCKWEGIVCNKDTGKVVSLDISNSSINGDGVSSRIFTLEDIEVLNLAHNDFNSSIPLGLDRFSKLTHLNLSNSGFIGQIPMEISTMTQLVSLDLSSNKRDFYYMYSSLKLENPDISTLIKDLINLKHLQLGGLNISSEVPIFLNKLYSLESLNLSYCGLSGDFPETVFSLKNLTNLDISHNPDLKVVIPGLSKNSVLRSLRVSSTNLSWMSAASLSNLYSLTRFDVSGCDISGSLPYWISTLKGLVHLKMSYNYLVGDIHSLQSLRELVYLDLSSNSFTGSIHSLQNLTELVHLDLSNNRFTGSILSLQNHINLTNLDLFSNTFSGEISFIDNLTKLKDLVISLNCFNGSIPKMENHQDLLEISLSSNNFADLFLSYLLPRT